MTHPFRFGVEMTRITSDATALARKLSPRFAAEPADVLSSPVVLVGNQAQIEDRLHQRRERWGYSYHVVQADRAHEFATVVQRLTGR